MLERRYDIDWIRVIAIGLLLLYHTVIGFQPWAVFIAFIQNDDPIESLWIPMSMINVWRIPLLFYVSGMGVAFAIKRRTVQGLLKERTIRILLPFAFGVLAIVPLHVFLWQSYYNQELEYWFHPFHLWFLGNIYLYVLLLSPFLFYLKKQKISKVKFFIKNLLSHPVGCLLMIIPFILEAELIDFETFETYAMNMHGFSIGAIAFITGFLFVFGGKGVWENLKKWVWLYLSLAFSLYLMRVLYFDTNAPFYLMAVESNLWIYAVLGLGYRYLNKPSKSLVYWSQAAYPIYILHMLFLYLTSYFIFPLDWNPWLSFVVVLASTMSLCIGTYHYCIRPFAYVRPFFGLKMNKDRNQKAQLNELDKVEGNSFGSLEAIRK
jgi:peptidoglycan/LPS O-acetylase OafA/YrhL